MNYRMKLLWDSRRKMSYKDTFAERKVVKQQAELLAIKHYENRGIKIIRAGMDALQEDIPGKHWVNTPQLIRNIPDFIIFTDDGNRFIECKNASETVKLKIPELSNYRWWNNMMPVTMFIYSHPFKTVYNVGILEIARLINDLKFQPQTDPNYSMKFYDIPVKELALYGTMDAQDGYYINDWNQVVKTKNGKEER